MCYLTGVTQGSILGPLLFIIFINDLPKISTFFSTRLYADDTSLTASGSDLDSLLCKINNHLPAVYDWLCSNKLTLNLTKTKYIIFMPRQKESYNLYPPLTVANVYLDKSSCVKYLGVYIDCHLTWHDHIDYICGKISKNVNIMVKLKRHVSEATLVSLYYSLIYPYLTYACTLWGKNYNAPLSQIVKLQNKAVRVINEVPGTNYSTLLIFTAKIASDLACAQHRYPCNTSGFSRQCYSGPQGSHLPIYANPLWFSVSFAKLRSSGPALKFLPLPPPLRRRMHLSSISVLRPSASAKSRFP